MKPLWKSGELSRDDGAGHQPDAEKGEITGIYGLVGSGRSEFLDLIFGIEHADKGTIKIGDRFLDKHTPKDSINAGSPMSLKTAKIPD